MAYFEFPHTRTYDSDLGWLIEKVKELSDTQEEFIKNNIIKFADPAQWDIASQYEQNTVVVDSDGTAYISKKPVPAGVNLNNTDYWMPIYNYSDFLNKLRAQIAHNNGDSVYADEALEIGDLVFLDGVLYKVTIAIPQGAQILPGTNAVQTTIEDEIKQFNVTIEALQTAITEEQTARENADQLLQQTIDSEVAARESADQLLQQAIDSETAARESADQLLQQAIDNEATTRENADAAIREIINTIKGGISAKISELETINITTVQNLIDTSERIDFDVDFDCGSATLTIPGNREIFSSNNSVIYGSSRIFQCIGSYTDANTTLTFTDSTHATASNPLDEDVEYMIKSTRSCVGDTTLPYPNYMGGGTVTDTVCYPTIYTTLQVSNGTDIVTAIPTYGVFNTGDVYFYNPLKGIHIHDLSLRSSGNASLNTSTPLYMFCCENCLIENVNIIINYGNCFTLAQCKNVVVRGCSASVENLTTVYHYDNNVYRLTGCYGCVVDGCSGSGSQPFDITYNGTDTCCSAFCIVSNCTSYATYTGLTTHPGTWSCVIDHLTVRNISGSAADGIAIRGSMHLVKNCYLWGAYETGAYGMGTVEGCLCNFFIDNFVTQYDAAFYVNEAANRPVVSGGTPFVEVHGNEFLNCRIALRLAVAVDIATFGYYMNFSNNVFRGNGSWTDPSRFVEITGSATSVRQFIAAVNNIIVNKTISQFINNGNPNCTFRRSIFELYSMYSASIDASWTGGSCNNIYLSLKGIVTSVPVNGTAIPALPECNTN